MSVKSDELLMVCSNGRSGIFASDGKIAERPMGLYQLFYGNIAEDIPRYDVCDFLLDEEGLFKVSKIHVGFNECGDEIEERESTLYRYKPTTRNLFVVFKNCGESCVFSDKILITKYKQNKMNLYCYDRTARKHTVILKDCKWILLTYLEKYGLIETRESGKNNLYHYDKTTGELTVILKDYEWINLAYLEDGLILTKESGKNNLYHYDKVKGSVKKLLSDYNEIGLKYIKDKEVFFTAQKEEDGELELYSYAKDNGKSLILDKDGFIDCVDSNSKTFDLIAEMQNQKLFDEAVLKYLEGHGRKLYLPKLIYCERTGSVIQAYNEDFIAVSEKISNPEEYTNYMNRRYLFNNGMFDIDIFNNDIICDGRGNKLSPSPPQKIKRLFHNQYDTIRRIIANHRRW